MGNCNGCGASNTPVRETIFPNISVPVIVDPRGNHALTLSEGEAVALQRGGVSVLASTASEARVAEITAVLDANPGATVEVRPFVGRNRRCDDCRRADEERRADTLRARQARKARIDGTATLPPLTTATAAPRPAVRPVDGSREEALAALASLGVGV